MSRQLLPRSELNQAPGPAAQQCVTFRHRTAMKFEAGEGCCTQVAPPSSVVSTVAWGCSTT